METSSQIPLGRMLANIGRLQATRIDQLMEGIGLFRGQAILLIMLGERDGVTHSEIAERLQISPAAATKVIKRLEKLHYLARRPDPQDERVSRLYLLDDGRAVLHQVRAVFHNINVIIAAGLSPDEQETLRALLTRVHKNLQDAPSEAPAIPELIGENR